jgi:hypothetical protein
MQEVLIERTSAGRMSRPALLREGRLPTIERTARMRIVFHASTCRCRVSFEPIRGRLESDSV